MTAFHRPSRCSAPRSARPGVAARGRDGNAVNVDAAEVGARFARAYARRGLDAIEAGDGESPRRMS